MVEQPDLDQRQRLAQTACDQLVRLARLGDARGMIVREDHGGGAPLQRLADHLTRMDVRAIERATEQLLAGEQPVTRVEEQAAEHLVWPVAQQRQQIALRRCRGFERVHAAQWLRVMATRELETGGKPGAARRADAAGASRCALRSGLLQQQGAQRARTREQAVGQLERIAACPAGAEQHGEQLGIRQCRGAACEQPLARPLGWGPVTQARRGGRSARRLTGAAAITSASGHTVHADAGRRGAASGESCGSTRKCRGRLRAAGAGHHNPAMQDFQGRRVLVGVAGGIAAYKTPDLVRRLRDAGAEVQVVLTAGAARFVTPLTFQAVSGRPVRDDLWDAAAEAAMGHIELARWADLLLIAPASADLIARLAAGLADDLLTTVCLATQAPVAIAPAMNRVMWEHPATRANVATLRDRGVALLGPAAGAQACGETGVGRMLEPFEILAGAAPLLAPPVPPALAGVRVLLTAGPTRERLDPVRFISNRSSGKMGFAVAAAARAAGADVVLVAGPVQLPTPPGVRRIDVESAADMLGAVQREVAAADVFIATAAVADYRPAQPAPQKIKKTATSLELDLERTIDILATVAAAPSRPFVVGFAAETENVEQHARAKLLRKNLDMIAANEVGDDKVFEKDDNELLVLWSGGRRELGPGSKAALARELVALIAEQYRTAPRRRASA